MNAMITAQSTSRTLDIDGAAVHFHDAGEGPVLLCIHGGAPGAYGWGNFGPAVPHLAQYRRVIVVDLPGYGRSAPRQIDGGRYGFYADLFARLLAELGIDRADVLGLATGGAVAMMLAVHHAALVDDLVLVSTAGGLPLFSVMPSEGQKAIRAYYHGEGPSPERMRSYIELMMYDQSLITDELVQERYEASIANARVDESKAVNEPVWREVDRITARTLIIWGRENRVQGFDNGLFLLKQIPNADFHIFSRAGLWVPYERPEDFAGVVRHFLEAGSAK